MPDTPPDIVAEIGKSPSMRRLKRELITGARFQQEYMLYRQARVNEANRIIESRRIEGVGTRIARIDQELYFQMMNVYGPDCWRDPEFLKDTLAKNPGMALRVREEKIAVAVDGFRDDDKAQVSRPGASENSAGGRSPDAAIRDVPVIKHSPASPPATPSKIIPFPGAATEPPEPAPGKIIPFPGAATA